MVIQNGHPPDQALTCHDPGTPKNAHPDCWVNPWPRVFPASTTGVHLPQSRAQSKDNSECVRKQLVSWKPWSLHCAWFWHVLRASKKMNRPQMFHFFVESQQLLCFEWSPPWHFKTACWHHFCLKLLSRDFCPTNYPNHLFHLAGHCACQSVKQDIKMSVGHVK